MSQRTREDAPEADKVCYDNDDNDDAMRLLSAHLMKNKWEFVSARLTITWSGKFGASCGALAGNLPIELIIIILKLYV